MERDAGADHAAADDYHGRVLGKIHAHVAVHFLSRLAMYCPEGRCPDAWAAGGCWGRYRSPARRPNGWAGGEGATLFLIVCPIMR